MPDIQWSNRCLAARAMDCPEVMELLIATSNTGKLIEIEAMLKNLPIQVLSLASLTAPPKVIEDGKTFEDNAFKKARTLADFSGYATLADDSGLMVDALGGEPGVRSARYAGEDATDDLHNQKLLRALANVPAEKRTARFVCVLALCLPSSSAPNHWFFRGECEGRIAFAQKGENGFGYDPVFFYPPLAMTFAELGREAKSHVSHRGSALTKLARALRSLADSPINP